MQQNGLIENYKNHPNLQCFSYKKLFYNKHEDVVDLLGHSPNVKDVRSARKSSFFIGFEKISVGKKSAEFTDTQPPSFSKLRCLVCLLKNSLKSAFVRNTDEIKTKKKKKGVISGKLKNMKILKISSKLLFHLILKVSKVSKGSEKEMKCSPFLSVINVIDKTVYTVYTQEGLTWAYRLTVLRIFRGSRKGKIFLQKSNYDWLNLDTINYFGYVKRGRGKMILKNIVVASFLPDAIFFHINREHESDCKQLKDVERTPDLNLDDLDDFKHLNQNERRLLHTSWTCSRDWQYTWAKEEKTGKPTSINGDERSLQKSNLKDNANWYFIRLFHLKITFKSYFWSLTYNYKAIEMEVYLVPVVFCGFRMFNLDRNLVFCLQIFKRWNIIGLIRMNRTSGSFVRHFSFLNMPIKVYFLYYSLLSCLFSYYFALHLRTETQTHTRTHSKFLCSYENLLKIRMNLHILFFTVDYKRHTMGKHYLCQFYFQLKTLEILHSYLWDVKSFNLSNLIRNIEHGFDEAIGRSKGLKSLKIKYVCDKNSYRQVINLPTTWPFNSLPSNDIINSPHHVENHKNLPKEHNNHEGLALI